jgi:uncharacterized protein (DUF2141 family)
MHLIKYLAPALFFSQAVHAAELTVDINNRKSSDSTIICGLFESKSGFPMESKKAAMVVNGSAEGDKTSCKFSNVKAGRLAIAVQEDLNANGKVDTTFVGFPKEPWGVSKDAPMHTFGPPTFDEAAIDVNGDTSIEIKLNQP